jgi:hypothetical protein
MTRVNKVAILTPPHTCRGNLHIFEHSQVYDGREGPSINTRRSPDKHLHACAVFFMKNKINAPCFILIKCTSDINIYTYISVRK